MTEFPRDARCATTETSMFPDDWGIGRLGRAMRSQALQACRYCPVKRQCGEAALQRIDSGQVLYGIHCGVVFNEVTPYRQARDVEQLRAVVARLH